MQSPSFLVLVSPDHFGFNPETASSNSFQKINGNTEVNSPLEEFRNLLHILEQHHISFKYFPSVDQYTPDAVFPNNWFSVHPCGTVFLYPMMAKNRRLERNPQLIAWVMQEFGHTKLIDLTHHEESGQFLEGTGSIVFHHSSETAFACISPRTSEAVLKKVCETLGYQSFVFRADDLTGNPVYHTNVMMAIATDIAIICSECISDQAERSMVLNKLANAGLEIIEINYSQMNSFAGNMFEVINDKGEKKLLMSESAFRSLHPGQLEKIRKHTDPIVIPIPSIETAGGGSIRCMVAGIFSIKTGS